MKKIDQIKLPDYLLELTDKVEETMGLISTGVSVPRISIRGRQFRFVVDGEEVTKQIDPINVIILGVEPEKGMAKTYYASGYQPGSSDPPDCSSWDGVSPDSWVDSPQNQYCANCEQNIWGSATALSGKKAKACKESKRLMILDAKDIEGQIYIFNVTIASLKALSEYGKFLVSNNIPMAAVITQIAFVDSEFPQVEFNFGGVLNKTIGLKMLKKSSDKEWKADIAPTLPAPKPAPQLEQSTQSAQLTPKVPITVIPKKVEVAAKAIEVEAEAAITVVNGSYPTNPPSTGDKSIDELLADWG